MMISAKPLLGTQNRELITHCKCKNMAHMLCYIQAKLSRIMATMKVSMSRLCDFHMIVVFLNTDRFVKRCYRPSHAHRHIACFQ